MTETECTRTGRKTQCHPGMLFIVTRDRGGRDDVMRKSPILGLNRRSTQEFSWPINKAPIYNVALVIISRLKSNGKHPKSEEKAEPPTNSSQLPIFFDLFWYCPRARERLGLVPGPVTGQNAGVSERAWKGGQQEQSGKKE